MSTKTVQRLARLRSATPEMVAAVQALVEAESPSGDRDGVLSAIVRTQELAQRLLGSAGIVVERDGVPHLLIGPARGARLVLLGHLDTVWPRGSLQESPFAVAGDRLRGPGCFDMKAGVVQGLFAVAEAGLGDDIAILLTGDEEVGSPSAWPLIVDTVGVAEAVLVLEPSAEGALKVERKGIGAYRLSVEGKAAHAGLEPEKGVNALLELASLVRTANRLADPANGTTVTPTRAVAGTTMNTVPAAAWADVDVRATSASELDRVDTALRALRPEHAEARLAVAGGVNRPPMERRHSHALFEIATSVARDLGLDALRGVGVGGVSDGNITAAMGIPTLDGLGAVGGGAHAQDEHVLVHAMADRAALAAGLIDAILSRSGLGERTTRG